MNSLGHRPRWIALGVLSMVLYCLISAVPHFIYGPGEDAISLTKEFNGIMDEASTKAAYDTQNRKLMCQKGQATGDCQRDDGNLLAQVYFFVAQIIAGIGQSLKHTLGISYLDDNIKKSKTPALISFSYFIRLLGPAFGYSLASYSLSMYVAPHLTPMITNKDPRWIGAWYFGWMIIATVLVVFGLLCALFPKELPRAAVRRVIAEEKEKRKKQYSMEVVEEVEEERSIKDFLITLKRLLKNKLFMLNNTAGVFYVFGYMPFWIYSAKLIETLFRQTAAASSIYTGTYALVASALGILAAGFFITKFKPHGRSLALWNVIVGLLSVVCILSFSFMGCEHSKNSVVDKNEVCNADCKCDLVKYSPVCGADQRTYISACHAGCSDIHVFNRTKIYDSCKCVDAVVHHEFKQTAVPGPCPINCQKQLYIFLAVLCVMKFIGATGRASNFLVGIRCVDPKDKSLAIGLGMSIVRLLASVPR